MALYYEHYPYRIHVGDRENSGSTNWCSDNLEAGEWAYCYFSEDGFHYFFKDKQVAVEFALKCL